jgi:hypothetical protein
MSTGVYMYRMIFGVSWCVSFFWMFFVIYKYVLPEITGKKPRSDRRLLLLGVSIFFAAFTGTAMLDQI